MTSAAQLVKHDAANDGHEHDGKQTADVNQGKDVAEVPRKNEREQYAEGEDDMAADDVGSWLDPVSGWGWQSFLLRADSVIRVAPLYTRGCSYYRRRAGGRCRRVRSAWTVSSVVRLSVSMMWLARRR
jgi:hypothetical protein